MFRNDIVMIVDDDLDDIELLTEALLNVEPRMRIITCQSGGQCIEQLQSAREEELPALLVLDYNMSDMDGTDVLKRIAGVERYGGMTKIVWSTSDSQQYQDSCLANGAHYYFKKPSTFPEVISMAEKMLEVSSTTKKGWSHL